MVKVGVLTFHWANSVGAILQAWAINKLLADEGYNVEIINFLPNLHLLTHRQVKPWKLVRKYKIMKASVTKVIYSSIGEAINYITTFETRRNVLFDDFRTHFMKISLKPINALGELREECSNYDICLVGSDQVWNPEYLNYSDFAYLLPFKLKKKVAFSASIGVDTLPPNYYRLYKNTLSDFNFISLREKTHLSMLSSLIGRKIYCTLDPTLLVKRECLETIASRDVSLPYDKFVLVYNIDFSMLPIAERITNTLKLPAIVYSKPPLLPITRKLAFSRYFKDTPQLRACGPREFLTLIKRAEFIITNSFHGTILSTYFEKPFIVLASKTITKVKSRILEFLELFGLQRRLFTPDKNLLEIIGEPIDYNQVKCLLSRAREDSLELLKMSLMT